MAAATARFPPWETVYRYHAAWQKLGIVAEMHRVLHRMVRISEMREPIPSVLIIDSEPVNTGKAGGMRGFDGGKRVKGRKRHMVVGTLGLMVDVAVSPTNAHDTEGAKRALHHIRKRTEIEPELVYADGDYGGRPFATWLRENFGSRIEISANLAQVAKRFEPRRVCRRRWVVSYAAILRLLAAAKN